MSYSDYTIRSSSELVDAGHHWRAVPGTGWFGYGPHDWSHTFPSGGTILTKGNEYQKLGKTSENIGGACVLDKNTVRVFPLTDMPSLYRPVGDADYLWNGVLPVWHLLPDSLNPQTLYHSVDFSEGAVLSDKDTLGYYGTQAIARTTPTKSQASLALTLVEMKRDGLPAVIGADVLKERCRDYRSMGREYLNVEFGWKPFVNDLKAFVGNTNNAHELMNRYYAEADRPIHRQYTFPEQISTTIVHQDTVNLSPFVTAGGRQIWDAVEGVSSVGQRQVTDVVSEKIWFSGAFQYHAPRPDDSVLGRLNDWRTRADYLYGINLDPDTLWNLAPWTWLPDYWVNVGDVVSNISTFLTMGDILRYGYIMRDSRRTRTIDVRFDSTVLGQQTHSAQYESRHFCRYGASPFGFGINPNSLTEGQWKILIALGLSNGRRSGGNFAM